MGSHRDGKFSVPGGILCCFGTFTGQGGCAPERKQEARALLATLLAMLETEEDRERFL